MDVFFHKKIKGKNNKDIIIESENDIFNIIIKYKENDIIVKLIELKEKLNEQNEKHYINKSYIYYIGKFKYDDIKDFLEKLNIKTFESKFNIKKKNGIISIENIILKEKKFNMIKKNPNDEIIIYHHCLNIKKYLFTLKQLKLNKKDRKIFDVFYFNKYFNEPCLILLLNQSSQINIIRMKDLYNLLTINLKTYIKQSIRMYDFFNETPPILKHYFIEGKDYIIYAFKNNMIIYDLNMNKIKYNIKVSPKFYIERLLFINNNNTKYLILNQINSYLINNPMILGEKNKVFNFNKGNIIQEINNTENDICFNIIYWNNDYVIKFCVNYIKIINFKTSAIYHQFNNNLNNLDGDYNNKNGILMVSTINTIQFYDLKIKILLKDIKLNNTFLEHSNIFKWNMNITFINCKKKLFIIDMNNFQIIGIFLNDSINCIKKIKIKEYGECLLNL